jgi:serine/threonine-protein kinase
VERIGEYEILEQIGRGAMGVVYRARDEAGREVALKVMASELTHDDELVERFKREAMTASRLEHPNVTQIFAFGDSDQQMFIAMELLEGTDLKDLIAKGDVGPLSRRLEMMLQASAGLSAVHAEGFVHRDLKPANLHVQSDGRVKIMDFGLVRLDNSEMTRTGMVLGSPSYMAPELVRGQRADARSDVFSLGAVFYELLSGQRPFPGRGMGEILTAIMNREPAPLEGMPPAVTWIIDRCLRKDPGQRYRTAGELHSALEVATRAYAGS